MAVTSLFLSLSLSRALSLFRRKSARQSRIEGATWGHFACHGSWERNSIIRAEREAESPAGAAPRERKKSPGVKVKKHSRIKVGLVQTSRGLMFSADLKTEELQMLNADLTMKEVQRSVRFGVASTVALSQCSSGRGEIRGEGVVGLARGFLFAGAAATVVSLWAVDDGSTAALMEQMYTHLEDGRTTAQALQLAMLHLLNGLSESSRNSRWSWPEYWASLPCGGRKHAPPRCGHTCGSGAGRR